MGMVSGPSGGIKSDINITPLVDVVLVLLIIFMVVTPMLQRGKDVKLPQAMKIEGKEAKESDPIILSITPDKRLFIENDELTEERFQEELSAKLAVAPNKKILLKGDNSLDFEEVRKVMNMARKAGAKGVGLGIEEKK